MTKKVLRFLLVFAAVCLLAGVNQMWAQGARATLNGRVTDVQGAVVPGAGVVVTSDDTGVKQTTKTNEQGIWMVQFLVPAHYSFSVSAAGFKQMDRHGITLQTGDNKQIDTQLELGAT